MTKLNILEEFLSLGSISNYLYDNETKIVGFNGYM